MSDYLFLYLGPTTYLGTTTYLGLYGTGGVPEGHGEDAGRNADPEPAGVVGTRSLVGAAGSVLG